MSTEDRRRRLGLEGLDDEAARKKLEEEHVRRAAEEAEWEKERAKIKAARKKKRP